MSDNLAIEVYRDGERTKKIQARNADLKAILAHRRSLRSGFGLPVRPGRDRLHRPVARGRRARARRTDPFAARRRSS